MKQKHVAWLVLMLVCLFSIREDIKMHEDLHHKIFSEFGVKSNINVGLFEGTTTGNISDVINMNASDYQTMQLSHNINDAEWYNTGSLRFYLLILVMIFGYYFCGKIFGESEINLGGDDDYERRL